MNKILVLGSSGSGKSTLANRLGTALNIPVLHLDRIYWEVNWKERDKDLYISDLREFMQRERYIIDGNHRGYGTIQERVKDADTIIFLNFNRFACFLGAIKRYFNYKGKSRSSMTPGCLEKIDFEFAKYILWDFPKRKRKELFPLIKQQFHGELLIFSNRKQLNNYLKKIGVDIND